MDKCRIRLIAMLARNDFECRRIPGSELKRLYSGYSCVGDEGNFFRKAKAMFPSLNCGIASLYLKERIPGSRLVKGRYGGECHTFLLAGRSCVVDITADQYGGPKVYVGPLKPPWKIS